jgi:four helix bundle protein
MRDFRELVVWQKSHVLTLKIYKASQSFPRDELYGLTSQIRRSASSIPTNIAEGCGRSSDNEFHRFLIIALGSISELEYQLILTRDLGYLPVEQYESLQAKTNEVKKITITFIRKLKPRDS